MILRPNVPMISPVKPHCNLGGTFDIPTGTFIKGAYGESLLKGGLPTFFALAGKANNFKSTIMAWMLLTMLYRLTNHASSLSWYDTEKNVELYRMASLAQRIAGYEDIYDIFERGLWVFTDSQKMPGNKWVAALQDFLADKLKNEKSFLRRSPFLDLDKTNIMMMTPTASAVDTISEFESEDVLAMREKTEIGQKEGNTIYMRQGLGKDRLIREAPDMALRGVHFMGFCAQWGEEKPDIGAGPMTPPKPKKMNAIPQGQKIRGVPDSFLYLPLHLWQLDGSKLLKDDDFYPLEDYEMASENADLWLTPMKMLRSKTGQSNIQLNIMVSQSRGVDVPLTEFYHIARTNKRWGMEGGGQYFTFDLDAEAKKYQRTTIRKELHRNPELARIVNLTSELCQIGETYPMHRGRIPPLKELREKLTGQGYDWGTLLGTRGWWTFDNDKHHVPFLSSMDLLNMYHGEYEPYWLESDKKTIRKEFQPG